MTRSRPLTRVVSLALAVIVSLPATGAVAVDANFDVIGAGLLKTQNGQEMIGMSEVLSFKSTGDFTSQAAGAMVLLESTYTTSAAGLMRANVTASKGAALLVEVPGTVVKKSKQTYARMAMTSSEIGGIQRLKIRTKNAGVKFKRKGKIYFGGVVTVPG